MKKQLTHTEREKLRSKFATHPLSLTSRKVFTPMMNHLKSLDAKPEDVFREAACMLDFLLYAQEITQRKVDGLWTLLVNDIREWKTDVSDEDKILVAGTVFFIVRDALCHHFELRYSEDICDMLTKTIEKQWKDSNEEKTSLIFKRLDECSSTLNDWINSYDEEEEWLSDEIAACLRKRKPERQQPNEITEEHNYSRNKVTIKSPPKYMTLKYVTHGINKDLTKRQRDRVKLLFEKWKTPEVKLRDGGWGWLDASVAFKDFCDLFEGNDRCCNLKIKRGKTNVMSIFFSRLLYYTPKGKDKQLIKHQTNQSAQQIMLEQFGANAINNIKRLISKSPTDIKLIKESIFILDWTVPLPLIPGGSDTDYDLQDETLQLCSADIDLGIEQDADVEQAVKSGVLRKGKHT